MVDEPKLHQGPKRARARAAEADHQPEASLAWPYDRATGKESYEA